MPVEEAIKQIETVIESLPKVANAQQRLLGIRMGADVRTLDTGTASSRSSGAGGAQEPEDWVPKVGEQVVVRCLLFPSFCFFRELARSLVCVSFEALTC